MSLCESIAIITHPFNSLIDFQLEKDLTPREKMCLHFAALDKSVTQTADALLIEPDTVRKYRKAALRKLHCYSITGAVVKANSMGLLQVGVPLDSVEALYTSPKGE